MKVGGSRERRAVLLAAVLAAACTKGKSGSGAPGDGSDLPPLIKGAFSLDQAAAVRDALCSYVVRCQVAPMDLDACRAASALQAGGFNSPEALFAAVQAGKVDVDTGKISQCTEAIRSLPCDNSLASVQVLSGCQEAFTGRVAVGGSCIAEGECVRGTRCVQSSDDSASGCSGTCTALAAGECADARDCASGQVCDGNGCVTLAAPGAARQPCGTADTCQAGLSCEGGLCLPLPGLGEACQPGGRCATGELLCLANDTGDATCEVAKGKGDSCTQPFQCGGPLSSLVCDVGGSNRCVERPRQGPCIQGECDPLSAFCDASQPGTPVCRPFLAAGAACDSPEQCGPALGNADCADDGTGTTRCVASPQLVCSP